MRSITVLFMLKPLKYIEYLSHDDEPEYIYTSGILKVDSSSTPREQYLVSCSPTTRAKQMRKLNLLEIEYT